MSETTEGAVLSPEEIRQIPNSERPRKFWAWLDNEIAHLESIALTEVGEARLSSLRGVKDKAEFYDAVVDSIGTKPEPRCICDDEPGDYASCPVHREKAN